MAVKVIDASAVAAFLFDEPEADIIAQRIAGARLVAPTLLGFELANVCLIKGRRHPDKRPALLRSFGLRHRLGIQELTVDYDASLALALATGLTVYDASYLWLSQELKAELITLDRQLAAAITQAAKD
ncbi:type II toxin-antitoxin system VapC family toxin [Acidisoma silvae]|uniref:Type II toxin-antitoxin system VapC family toxin n=1 Tax=Acidisoma silvae TaxID=2802396 RepID=A0A963YT34_9PROT|nr:type II toxin-antitoxin system VapC family toxin [Acidisoma silvae]MCB8876446.1 type II toxin-antitoxin system VapC family toxin [Acidisoma silvae]